MNLVNGDLENYEFLQGSIILREGEWMTYSSVISYANTTIIFNIKTTTDYINQFIFEHAGFLSSGIFEAFA
jgi:hypothetical protein